MKKLTTADYIQRCKKLHLDTPLDNYVNSKTPLRFSCSTCGELYTQGAYNHLKRGNNCEKCKRRNKFVNKLNDKYNGDYALVGDYKGSRIPIKFKHKCGYVFEDLPIYLTLQGINCPVCEHSKRIDMNAIKHYLIINYPEFELLSTCYKGIKSPLVLKHKVCGTQFERTFDKVKQRGLSCPNNKCGGRVDWNTEKVKKMLLNTYGVNYQLCSPYASYNSLLKIQCLKHHCSYNTTLGGLLRKGRDNSKTCNCPICANEQRSNNRTGLTKKKTSKEYMQECKEKGYDLPLEDYIKATAKIKHRCKKCGNIYEQTPDDHLHNKGCPKCNESHGEKFIRTYLDKNNIKYIPQKKFHDLKDKTYLSYDFYLPNYNILIEYQGLQHFIAGGKGKFDKDYFPTQQYHDKLKHDYALNNGYTLLEPTYKLNTQEKVNNYLDKHLKL